LHDLINAIDARAEANGGQPRGQLLDLAVENRHDGMMKAL
jgi:hypothetical protein